MASLLKERLERLGPVRAVDQVPFGSPVVLSLRPVPDRARLRTVSATLALARRGLPLLRAKRTIEEMVERGRAVVLVPKAIPLSLRSLSRLDAASHPWRRMKSTCALREQLGLTQERFALRYGLDLDAVRNWERKRRKPDPAAQSYLRVIARLPDQASEAQEEILAEPQQLAR